MLQDQGLSKLKPDAILEATPLDVIEVLLCHPGVLAMIHHRLAHQPYRLGLPLLAV